MKLKHLAPYLPYNLKAYQVFGKELLERDVTVHNVMSFVQGDTNAKIALRPLSDLTKEIDVNGEKFVPNLNKDFKYFIKEDLEYFISNILAAPYYQIEKLFEWHFDVFGLIGKGEAICISKL